MGTAPHVALSLPPLYDTDGTAWAALLHSMSCDILMRSSPRKETLSGSSCEEQLGRLANCKHPALTVDWKV